MHINILAKNNSRWISLLLLTGEIKTNIPRPNQWFALFANMAIFNHRSNVNLKPFSLDLQKQYNFSLGRIIDGVKIYRLSLLNTNKTHTANRSPI